LVDEKANEYGWATPDLASIFRAVPGPRCSARSSAASRGVEYFFGFRDLRSAQTPKGPALHKPPAPMNLYHYRPLEDEGVYRCAHPDRDGRPPPRLHPRHGCRARAFIEFPAQARLRRLTCWDWTAPEAGGKRSLGMEELCAWTSFPNSIPPCGRRIPASRTSTVIGLLLLAAWLSLLYGPQSSTTGRWKNLNLLHHPPIDFHQMKLFLQFLGPPAIFDVVDRLIDSVGNMPPELILQVLRNAATGPRVGRRPDSAVGNHLERRVP